MKYIISTLCLLLMGSIAASAQCNKNLRLTSSSTEYLDSSMTVTRTDAEKSIVEINNKTITIAPGNSDHTMTGTIESVTCNWTVPYKEGKSVFKAKIMDGDEERNATITIEGKDGQLTLLFEVAEMQNQKIRVSVDTFEEKK